MFVKKVCRIIVIRRQASANALKSRLSGSMTLYSDSLNDSEHLRVCMQKIPEFTELAGISKLEDMTPYLTTYF